MLLNTRTFDDFDPKVAVLRCFDFFGLGTKVRRVIARLKNDLRLGQFAPVRNSPKGSCSGEPQAREFVSHPLPPHRLNGEPCSKQGNAEAEGLKRYGKRGEVVGEGGHFAPRFAGRTSRVTVK